MDEQWLADRVANGASIAEVAEASGKAYTTVRYWLNKYGLRTEYSLRHTKISLGTDPQVVEAVNSSISVRGALKKLEKDPRGSNYRALKRRVAELGLSTAHWKGKAHGTSGKCRQRDLSEYLVRGGPEITTRIKKRLILGGYLENKCQICGLPPSWNGKLLVLRLDHKNGVHSDSRISNLRLLCPNCDSQAVTFCGRNKRPGPCGKGSDL